MQVTAKIWVRSFDLFSSSHTGALDAAAVHIQQLEETVKELMKAVAAESGSSAFSQILCLRRGHPFLHQIHVKRCFL